MNDENREINKEEKEKRQMVSFSETDEKGNFRETCGYIDKKSDGLSFEERVKEMAERIKKR